MKYILIFLLSFNVFASHSKKFEKWKKSFAKKAARRGLKADFVLKQLKGIEYMPEIIEKDRNQVTSSGDVDYPSWMKKWLREDEKRIKEGKEMLFKHAKILEQVEKKFKVDKEVLVSLWGVETFYGQITGDYNVIDTLSTLAYDKRRRRFFEAQLIAALKLVARGHIEKDDFKGSWAGATGQCQFMPSNVLVYGVDFDKDGKIDIWNNYGDIFASMAKLLKKAGWKKGRDIGMLAKKTKNKKFNYKRYRTPRQYNKLGLRTLDGDKLKGRWKRKIAKIPFQNSPVLLRGSNYKPLLRWNRSSLFAAMNVTLIEGFKR